MHLHFLWTFWEAPPFQKLFLVISIPLVGPIGLAWHLDPINRLADTRPWKVSFPYGHALQDTALSIAWAERGPNGRLAGILRPLARTDRRGLEYMDDGDRFAMADDPPHRRDWHDG
jgi:hypothetical protein